MTQKDSQSALMVERVQAVRLMHSEVRASKGWAVKGSENSNEADEFTLARKAANERVRRPYRKPTQVGRKMILRPTGEGLLRTSAS